MTEPHHLLQLHAILNALPGWVNHYFVFRNIAMELALRDAKLWATIKPKLESHAYESVALDLLPEGFTLSGVRRELDGNYVAVLYGPRMLSSKVRPTAALALFECVLLAAMFSANVTALEESNVD